MGKRHNRRWKADEPVPSPGKRAESETPQPTPTPEATTAPVENPAPVATNAPQRPSWMKPGPAGDDWRKQS